jgi:hypothetical protein
VGKLGEVTQGLVDPKPAKRVKAREDILSLAGEHPIGGLLAPFLVRLLADPALPDRGLLLPLLTTIAVGNRPLARFDRAGFVAHLRRSRRERFEAVGRAAPVALHMLGDTDPASRSAAACLLSYLQPDGFAVALHGALSTETDPLVLGSLLVAIGISSALVAEERARVASFLSHADSNVSLAAALALAVQAGPADEATMARLERALEGGNSTWDGFPWGAGNVGALASATYLALADRHLDRVLEHVVGALAGDVQEARKAIDRLLDLALPAPLAPGAPLPPPVARLIRAMVTTPGVADPWWIGQLVNRGLPKTENELRDLIGLEISAPPVVARTIRLSRGASPLELPLHVAWCRRWWGRLDADPAEIVEQGFLGLGADDAAAAFRALVVLSGTDDARISVSLPLEPAGVRNESGGMREYRDEEPAMARTARFVDGLVAAGWELVLAPWAMGNFGYAAVARGGVVLKIDTNAHWQNERQTNQSVVYVRPNLSLPRLLAPFALEHLGDRFVRAVTELAAREDLENMVKWGTLELAALLATLGRTLPDRSVDDLFRRCYVSWPPLLPRVVYLKSLPEDRAEELALWLMEKEPRATWVATFVPTEKVKAKAKVS